MRFPSVLKDDRGAVLVIAILIMAVLAVIGIAASTTSSIEIKIAGNEKNAREAFYAAEAAWPTAMSWLNGRGTPFTGNDAADTPSPCQVQDTSIGGNGFDYELRYQAPPRDILGSGFSLDYKDFYYEIDCTGNGPAESESMVQVTVSRAFKVDY